MQEQITFSQLLKDLEPIVAGLADTSRSTSWNGEKTYSSMSGGVTCRADHPFTTSTVVATLVAGARVNTELQLITVAGKRFKAHVKRIREGTIIISALASLISALVTQRVLERVAADPGLNEAQRGASLARLDETRTRVREFAQLPPLLINMAEEAVLVSDNDIYIHRPAPFDPVDAVSTVPVAQLPTDLIAALDGYKLLVAADYQALSGAPITPEEMQAKLEEAGVSAWLSSDFPWIRLPVAKRFDITLSPEQLHWARDMFPHMLGYLPTYLRALYPGRALSPSEIGSTAADFASIGYRLGLTTEPRFAVDAQIESSLELAASVLQTADPQRVVDIITCSDYVAGRIAFDTSALPLAQNSADIVALTLIRHALHQMPALWPSEVNGYLTLRADTNDVAVTLPSGAQGFITVDPRGAVTKAGVIGAIARADYSEFLRYQMILFVYHHLAYTALTFDQDKDSIIAEDGSTYRLRYDIQQIGRLLAYYIIRGEDVVIVPVR